MLITFDKRWPIAPNLLFTAQVLLVDGRRGHPLHGLLDDLGVEIAQVGRVDAIDGGAT